MRVPRSAKRHSRTLGARRIACSLSFGSSAAIASRRRTDFRVAPARFWSQMRRYDPHVSWPYTKCLGARADGERCQARVNSGGAYCHHHDPARKMSAPTAALASVPARPARGSSAPSVLEKPDLAAFAEALRRGKRLATRVARKHRTRRRFDPRDCPIHGRVAAGKCVTRDAAPIRDDFPWMKSRK